MNKLDSRTVIVSAADSGYFPMLLNLLTSIECSPDLADTVVAVFDLGLSEQDRAFLAGRSVRLLQPRGHFGLDIEGEKPVVPALLVRPFLEDYLPDFDCFIWIDADAWVQDADTVRALEAGARRSGLSLVHEREPTYGWTLELRGWVTKHCLQGYGLVDGMRMLSRPMLNAGVYAVRRGAPHVELWREQFRRVIERTGRVVPHDQFSLNAVVWLDRPETDILEPKHNWICNRSLPCWDPHRRLFCTASKPHRPLGIVHLAGHLKTGVVEVKTVDGRRRNLRLHVDPLGAAVE